MPEQIPLGEEISHIILSEKDNNFYVEEGRVPLNWSWELEEDKDMPHKAFILYTPMDDGMEMRQIYVARRFRKQRAGARILGAFEQIVEMNGMKNIYIKVRFTDHDPDNIFHDFLVSQGYKPDINKPESLWTKQL